MSQATWRLAFSPAGELFSSCATWWRSKPRERFDEEDCFSFTLGKPGIHPHRCVIWTHPSSRAAENQQWRSTMSSEEYTTDEEGEAVAESL
jgi:hypothetical protein